MYITNAATKMPRSRRTPGGSAAVLNDFHCSRGSDTSTHHDCPSRPTLPPCSSILTFSSPPPSSSILPSPSISRTPTWSPRFGTNVTSIDSSSIILTHAALQEVPIQQPTPTPTPPPKYTAKEQAVAECLVSLGPLLQRETDAKLLLDLRKGPSTTIDCLARVRLEEDALVLLDFATSQSTGCEKSSKVLTGISAPQKARCQSPSSDSTDDDEGDCESVQDFICHGNHYRISKPSKGNAFWALLDCKGPGKIASEDDPPSRLEDHIGELQCPRCRLFERMELRQHSGLHTFADRRHEREQTIALSADAADDVTLKRGGAARYDDALYEDTIAPVTPLTACQLRARRQWLRHQAGKASEAAIEISDVDSEDDVWSSRSSTPSTTCRQDSAETSFSAPDPKPDRPFLPEPQRTEGKKYWEDVYALLPNKHPGARYPSCFDSWRAYQLEELGIPPDRLNTRKGYRGILTCADKTSGRRGAARAKAWTANISPPVPSDDGELDAEIPEVSAPASKKRDASAAEVTTSPSASKKRKVFPAPAAPTSSQVSLTEGKSPAAKKKKVTLELEPKAPVRKMPEQGAKRSTQGRDGGRLLR